MERVFLVLLHVLYPHNIRIAVWQTWPCSPNEDKFPGMHDGTIQRMPLLLRKHLQPGFFFVSTWQWEDQLKASVLLFTLQIVDSRQYKWNKQWFPFPSFSANTIESKWVVCLDYYKLQVTAHTIHIGTCLITSQTICLARYSLFWLMALSGFRQRLCIENPDTERTWDPLCYQRARSTRGHNAGALPPHLLDDRASRMQEHVLHTERWPPSPCLVHRL